MPRSTADAVSGGGYGANNVDGRATLPVTVADDETASTEVRLSVNPSSVGESAGQTTVTVTGTLDGAPRLAATAVTVSVGASGDAAVAGTDYAAVDDFTLTITAGQSSGSATFVLTPTADDVAEADETLTVGGTVAGLEVAAATLTITDDDVRGVTFSGPTLSVPEGGDATYTVVLESEPTGPVTVTPSLASGSNTDVTVSPGCPHLHVRRTGIRRRRSRLSAASGRRMPDDDRGDRGAYGNGRGLRAPTG